MIENKNIYSGSEVDEMRSLIQVHDGWLADKDPHAEAPLVPQPQIMFTL